MSDVKATFEHVDSGSEQQEDENEQRIQKIEHDNSEDEHVKDRKNC